MAWFIIAAVLLMLMLRALHGAPGADGSRALTLLGTALDGVAAFCLLFGVFGALMAIVLGVVPEAGLRITTQSLSDMVLASLGLLAVGVAGLFSGALARRAGRRRPARAAGVH